MIDYRSLIKRINDRIKTAAYKKISALRLRNEVNFIEQFDISPDDLSFSKDLLEKPINLNTNKTVNWIVPSFNHIYAGVFTILRIANNMQQKGYYNNILIYDNPNFVINDKLRSTISNYFPHLNISQFASMGSNILDIPESDYSVATYWTSCYILLRIKNTKRKIYLIQDYEPEFNVAGSRFGLVESTYFFPFHRIFNTPGLQNFVDVNYPNDMIKSTFLTPAVDDRYLFTAKELTFPIMILFYGRPSKSRNGFELMMAIARRLKERYGDDVEIVSAGESYNLREMGLGKYEKYFKNMNVIPYDDLPQFYSQFHFAISFMFTKHPSYIPFELMASGSVMIVNRNIANTWLFQDKENCICTLPFGSSIIQSIDEVINNPDLYKQMAYNGYKTVKYATWENELSKIYDFFEDL
ncbi:MAG: glycosyltransferase [Syntrophales bacterium]